MYDAPRRAALQAIVRATAAEHGVTGESLVRSPDVRRMALCWFGDWGGCLGAVASVMRWGRLLACIVTTTVPNMKDPPPPSQAAHQMMGGLHCRQRWLSRPHHQNFPPPSPPARPAVETTPEQPHPHRLLPGAAPRANWWAPPVRHDHRGHPPTVKDGSTTARPERTAGRDADEEHGCPHRRLRWEAHRIR